MMMMPKVPEIEQGGSASQDDDEASETTFAPPRKSRLSAPQLQAHRSLLPDRTRRRRLKKHFVLHRSVAAGDKD